MHYLRKRLGLLEGRKIFNSSIKMSIAASVMGIITYLSKEFLFSFDDPIKIRIVALMGCISIGMLIYAIISHLFNNEEWQFLLDLKKNKSKELSADSN